MEKGRYLSNSFEYNVDWKYTVNDKTIQPSLNTGNISVHKSLQGWWISLTLYFNKLRSPLLYFNLVNYQILIDKKQTDLRKNTLSSLEGGSETVGKILNDIDKRVDFLLCPSCFWCATYFNFGELSIIRCPICHNNCIDQLPVSINKAWPYLPRNVILYMWITRLSIHIDCVLHMSCTYDLP